MRVIFAPGKLVVVEIVNEDGEKTRAHSLLMTSVVPAQTWQELAGGDLQAVDLYLGFTDVLALLSFDRT
ncbi:hypothetical protein AB2N08_20860 [Massilia aurea]|uniref:hypothetical protein n=1 Tax=Massilia aurea TaxID=373040 RepID=UPI003462A101